MNEPGQQQLDQPAMRANSPFLPERFFYSANAIGRPGDGAIVRSVNAGSPANANEPEPIGPTRMNPDSRRFPGGFLARKHGGGGFFSWDGWKSGENR